jgi:hypothetical protein
MKGGLDIHHSIINQDADTNRDLVRGKNFLAFDGKRTGADIDENHILFYPRPRGILKLMASRGENLPEGAIFIKCSSLRFIDDDGTGHGGSMINWRRAR